MNATFNRSEHLGSDIYSFWFETERPLPHIAGQFVELTIAHDSSDARGTKRWFTLSSAPTESLITITTRLPANPSSFKQRLSQLSPGDTVLVSDAMGDFVLPLSKSTPLLFVAAGIGSTPFHSIARWLTDTNEKRPIRIVLAANQPDEFVWSDLFKQIDPHLELIVSRPTPGWQGLTGRLTAAFITQRVPRAGLTYISGSEQMVEALTKQLVALGIPQASLIGDYFPGYVYES